RVGRLVVVLRAMARCGKVRQVRDDDLDGLGNRIEQISFEHVHAIGHAVTRGGLAGELDRVGVDVGREDLKLRRGDGDREAEHTAAGSDGGDSTGRVVDSGERRLDQRLRRRARSEDTAGRGHEIEPVKGRLGDNRLVTDWDAHYRREAERYLDGENRLPETA